MQFPGNGINSWLRTREKPTNEDVQNIPKSIEHYLSLHSWFHTGNSLLDCLNEDHIYSGMTYEYEISAFS